MINRFYLTFILEFIVLQNIFFGTHLFAQKVYEGVLYPYNKYYLNPAYTGLGNEQNLTVLLNYRGISSSLQGLPAQLMFGVHTRLNKNMGLGLRINNYSEGLFNFFTGFADYSYKVEINSKQFLRFGASLGISANALDKANIVASDPSAIIELANKNFIGNQFISSAGIAYEYNELNLSLSTPILFGTGAAFNPGMAAYAAYRIPFKNKILGLMPSAYVLAAKDLPVVYDLMVLADYQKQFQLGMGYRNSKSLIFSFGVVFSDLRINYAADIDINKYSNIYNVLHELSIAYSINTNKKSLKDSVSIFPLIVHKDSVNNMKNDSLVVAENSKINKQTKEPDSLTSINNYQELTTKTIVENKEVIELGAGIYSFNLPDSAVFNEHDLDSLVNKINIQSNKNLPVVEEVSDGVYSIDDKEAEADSILNNMLNNIIISDNSEINQTNSEINHFFDDYYTIVIDIANCKDAINKHAELLENFSFRKNKNGKVSYIYGKFLSKGEAEESVLVLRKKGFKILSISIIGKL